MDKSVGLKEEKPGKLLASNPEDQIDTDSLSRLLTPPSETEERMFLRALSRIEDVLVNVLGSEDISEEVAKSFVELELYDSSSPLSHRVSIIASVIKNALEHIESEKITEIGQEFIETLTEKLSSFEDFVRRAELGHRYGIDSEGASYQLLTAAINSLSLHLSSYEEHLATLFYKEPPLPEPEILLKEEQLEIDDTSVAEVLKIPEREVIQPEFLAPEEAPNPVPPPEEKTKSLWRSILSSLFGWMKSGASEASGEEAGDVYRRMKHNDGTPKLFPETSGIIGTSGAADRDELERERAQRIREHFLANTPEDGVIGLNQAQNPLPDLSKDRDSAGTSGTSSSSTHGQSNQDMIAKGLDGKIVTEDQEFYKHVAVTAPAVTIDDRGKMLRLDTWLRAIKEANPDNTALPTYEECYKSKTVLPLSHLDERTKGDTECSRSAFPGDVTLPLSPFYTITGLSFLDSAGNEIKTEHQSVDECIFGSARVIAPEGTMEVSYRVRPKNDQRIDEDLLRKFEYALPKLSGYIDPADMGALERLRSLTCEPADKTQLWFTGVKDTPYAYLYTTSDPVKHLINASGPHAETFIAALKASDCQGFSFHASARLRNLGLGALVIGGPLPDKEHKSFQVKIGHAQTAVMGKKGLTILDVTKYVAATLEAEALPIDWKQIVSDLEGVSAIESYAIGQEVGKLIRQMAGSQNFDLDVKNHRYALKGWSKFRHSLSFGRSEALTSSQLPGHQVTDSIKHAKENIFAKVIAVQKYLSDLEERAEAALSKGSLLTVYRCIEETPPPTFSVSYEDEKQIGEEYSRLVRGCHHRVKEMLVDATEKVLQEEAYTEESKRECVAWIATKSIPSNFESFEKGIDEDIDTVQPSGSYLTLNERSRLLTDEVRRQCNDEELQRLVVVLHNDARHFCARTIRKFGEYDHGVAELKNSLKTLELCTKEIYRRSIRFNPDVRHQIFLRSLTHISDTVFFRAERVPGRDQTVADFKEIKDSLVHCFDYVLQRGEGNAAETSLRLLTEVSSLERRHVVKMLQEVWKSISSHGNTSFSKATASYLIPRIQDGNNDHYLLTALEEIGISIDFTHHRDALEEAYSAAGTKLSIRWQDQAINYPDEEAPASYLTERLSSLEAARYHRYMESIVSYGGLREENVKAGWPQVSEADVAYRLASLLEVHDEKLQIKESEYSFRRPALEIHPEDICCLVEAGYKHGPLSKAFLKHYYESNPDSHELESVFQRIKDDFPEAWKQLRHSIYGNYYNHEARFVGALFARYAEGIDKVSFYRASLQLAASRLREDSSGMRLHERTPSEIEAVKESNLKEAIAHLITELGRKRAGEILLARKFEWKSPVKSLQLERQYNVLMREYHIELRKQAAEIADKALDNYCLSIASPEVSPEKLVNVYASIDDRYDAHKDGVGERELALAVLLAGVSNELTSTVISHMCNKIGLPAYFIGAILSGIERNDVTGMQRVWEYLRSDAVSSNLTTLLPRVIEDVKAKVDRATLRPHALRPATFSSYLYDKTGRKTPLQYEGDFEEFRSYSHGMDWKRVDQKVLARTDKPYVRYYRDRQKHNVVALVELEWLADEAASWRESQSQNEQARNKEESYRSFGRRRTRSFVDNNMTTELAAFPKLEELYTNLLLADRDGYQPKLVFTFRGRPVELVQKGERDDVKTYTEASFLNRLEKALIGASWVVQAEKDIYPEGRYQGRAPILPQYLEDLKNTVVLCGIDSDNVKQASWFFNLIRKRGGDTIPLEIRDLS